MNFKNAKEMSQLQDSKGGLGQAIKHEAGTKLAGNLETLHQGCDAGTVDVFHAGHVDEQGGDAVVFQLDKDGFADFGRIEKSNIPDEVENGDVA